LTGLTSKTVAAFSTVITGANGMNSERVNLPSCRNGVNPRAQAMDKTYGKIGMIASIAFEPGQPLELNGSEQIVVLE
jgi:hypothetical protein